MDVTRMDRSLAELFSDLSEQTGALIRQELRLAKVELSEKAADAARHATMIAAGAVFAFAAVVTFAAALTLVLVEAGVVPWLAALLAAAAMGLTGFLLAQAGITALKRKPIAPVETIRSLKETTQWLKTGTR